MVEGGGAGAHGTPAGRTMPIGVAEMLRLAKGYSSAGRLREADALYERVLAIHPRHPEALHCRGLIAARLGRVEEAIGLVRQAVAARHDLAPAHLDLARLLRGAGRLEEAFAAARRAVRFAPASASAHAAMGEILGGRGEAKEALIAHA